MSNLCCCTSIRNSHRAFDETADVRASEATADGWHVIFSVSPFWFPFVGVTVSVLIALCLNLVPSKFLMLEQLTMLDSNVVDIYRIV